MILEVSKTFLTFPKTSTSLEVEGFGILIPKGIAGFGLQSPVDVFRFVFTPQVINSNPRTTIKCP